MDITSSRLQKIVCDIRCTRCPADGRCVGCQEIVDLAIASTLAQGISPDHIHVAPAAR